MRNKKVAFLSCAVVAAAGLLATPAAMATGSQVCNSTPTITVVKDAYGVQTPCPVVSVGGGNWRCAGPSEATEYTGIRYQNTSGPAFNHVATLVTRNNVVVVPSGWQLFTDCKGDTLTKLGAGSCHENALKINGVPATGSFWVVVTGRKTPIETTIATKAGSTVKCFPITGLGLTASTNQLIQQVQRVTSQDGCAVDFVTDALSGDPISVKLTPESVDNGCTSPSLGTDGEIAPLNASEFEVKRNGQSYGTWKFGEGYIRSGTNSCTTRVIGGRVYTWGSPCPD